MRLNSSTRTTLVIAASLFGSPPSVLFAQGEVAGYQSISDCNENNIPDTVESYRFFVVPLKDLQGEYGGIIGMGHSASFQFPDDFLIVHHAWLRLSGIADSSWPSPVDLGFYVRLDSESWGQKLFSDLDEYEICIPLVPPAVNGTVSLVILIGNCCDHISVVESASLWLDAVPTPPPQSLQDFAELQNCIYATSNSAACDASDVDWDSGVDLVDLSYLVQFLSDP